MQFVCDAPGRRTWFRIETEAEAAQESELMRHAVEKHYRRAHEAAAESYDPTGIPYIEQGIRRATHIRRAMPAFFTLRNEEGQALVTAMLPSPEPSDLAFRPVVVGPGNSDPYPQHGDAIEVLGRHVGVTLDRARCYPYRRG
ncbi:hypothetical protein [Roseicella frigidaeris]|uniref:Uncharacterized protein n=1 Tax=Roseicella frigidaeris TaxID=2230885 RepID=A0A327LVX0_9PROT|nr:hypothetical protein [Roseicella frigidaeris]RAI54566.1 hypothetical protein DOO78_26000 [Roseicella frigidaeris]